MVRSIALVAVLCLLAFASCEARSTRVQRMRSASRSYSSSAASATSQTRDNGVFVSALKALDAKRATTPDESALREKCYFAYQKDLYVHGDFNAYGKAYAAELGKVWDALAVDYDIGSFTTGKALNKKDLLTTLVTGTLLKPKNQGCPLVPMDSDVKLRKGMCIISKQIGDFYAYESTIDCKKITREFVKAQYPKQVVEVTQDPNPEGTPPKEPVTHVSEPTEKQQARRDKRERRYYRELEILQSGKCNFLFTEFEYFVRLDPKTKPVCATKDLLRVSLSLKPSDHTRPAALFPILKELLLNAEMKKVLKYSKIETMAQRQDAILLQLCYDPANVKATTDLLTSLTTTIKTTHAASISDDGPYFQKPHGAFFIADYTLGSSFGRDLCCLWQKAGSTDNLEKFVGLVSSAAPVLKFAPDWVTSAGKGTCKVEFDVNKLAAITPDTKPSDVKLPGN